MALDEDFRKTKGVNEFQQTEDAPVWRSGERTFGRGLLNLFGFELVWFPNGTVGNSLKLFGTSETPLHNGK